MPPSGINSEQNGRIAELETEVSSLRKIIGVLEAKIDKLEVEVEKAVSRNTIIIGLLTVIANAIITKLS